jgi:two-component system phosphate regulon sensor histidine kinase PhoR
MRFLSIIRQNAERLASLTADLLTLSRIELQRRNFEFDLYNVHDMLSGAVETIRPIAARKNLRLDLRVDPECGQAYCDAEAVHQILINLLDNAIKYTPEAGSVEVIAAPSRGQVEISVRDSGIGIPSEDLPRLFERFYRVDKARSRELGGTGLGLAIVKHLVRAQGGDVRVESVPNQGSTFSFALSCTVHDSVTVR